MNVRKKMISDETVKLRSRLVYLEVRKFWLAHRHRKFLFEAMQSKMKMQTDSRLDYLRKAPHLNKPRRRLTRCFEHRSVSEVAVRGSRRRANRLCGDVRSEVDKLHPFSIAVHHVFRPSESSVYIQHTFHYI